ncbi:uncharacterized protein LOC127257814 [Andrographis paniculata]|uniref:uncharacterized protein LOC127257814 n=1 Tax=Andrographis paniculata TaxID=175694 RepID=UPI0021E86473|nr:uncharacterized protein LOC127257814 [Andrographis paniculata]
MLSVCTNFTHRDNLMIKSLLCFWSPSINAFVFPFGILAPTVLDVVVILGLPSKGIEPHLSPLYNSDRLPIPVAYDSNTTVSQFIASNMLSGHVESLEHNAFLMFWFSKYFICCALKGFVREVEPIVHVLMSGVEIVLASYFLGLLCHGVNEFLGKLSVSSSRKPVGVGPLWFLELWARLYFPNLISPRPELPSRSFTALGLHLASYPSFQGDLHSLTHSLLHETNRSPADFIPLSGFFSSRDASIVDTANFSNSMSWNKFLTARILVEGLSVASRYNSLLGEVYQPQYCARQFGLVQGIPLFGYLLPPPLSAGQTLGSSLIDDWHAYIRDIEELPHSSYAFNPNTLPSFDDWWAEFFVHSDVAALRRSLISPGDQHSGGKDSPAAASEEVEEVFISSAIGTPFTTGAPSAPLSATRYSRRLISKLAAPKLRPKHPAKRLAPSPSFQIPPKMAAPVSSVAPTNDSPSWTSPAQVLRVGTGSETVAKSTERSASPPPSLQVSHGITTPGGSVYSARVLSPVSAQLEPVRTSPSPSAPLAPKVVPADVEAYFAQSHATDASAPTSFEDLCQDPFSGYQFALPEDSAVLDTLQASVLTAAASLSLGLPRRQQLEELAECLGKISGRLKMLQGVRGMNDSKLKELVALETEKAACARSFLDEKQRAEDETTYIEGLHNEEKAFRAELRKIEERLREISP